MSCRSSMRLVSPPHFARSSCTRTIRHHTLRAMSGTVEQVLSHERVCAARAHIHRSDEATLARQVALSAIPAPTGAEGARGARVAAMLDDAGLTNVEIDDVGNVRGWHGISGPHSRDGGGAAGRAAGGRRPARPTRRPLPRPHIARARPVLFAADSIEVCRENDA